jgi:hypothetical protein
VTVSRRSLSFLHPMPKVIVDDAQDGHVGRNPFQTSRPT